MYLVSVVLFGVVGGRHHNTSTEAQTGHSEGLRGRRVERKEEMRTFCTINQSELLLFIMCVYYFNCLHQPLALRKPSAG